MKLYLLLIIFSVFFISCEFFETTNECNPICENWETCNDEGHCVLKNIACTEASDCPDVMPVCDILNHVCIEDDSAECYADDECIEPDKPICHKGICIEKPDDCTVNSDCTNINKPICENGFCVAEPCEPLCSNKECGSDGCGDVCGTCGQNKVCNSSYQCVDGCTPDCTNKDCGDDGCGGSCGDCLATQSCSSNQCVDNCTPDCTNKDCGDDGCGGSCGDCLATQSCSSNQCVDNCTPDCTNKDCGDDGCGGSCGDCLATQSCNSNQCVDNCTPDCTNKDCGDDGCGGSCGDCLATQSCNSNQCVDNCTPDCTNKDCGDDGCGGSCGDCLATQSCSSNQCVDNPDNSFNGSFENWTSNILDDWSVLSQLILEKEETIVSDLAISVKLTRDSSADDNALTALESIPISVLEGSTYTLSAYVLDNSPTVRIRINYMWLDVNGDKIGTSVYGGYSSDSPDWENLTKVTDAAPVGAVSIVIFFRVYNDGAGGNTGSVYLDDVTITKN